jgi:hypothetical protein
MNTPKSEAVETASPPVDRLADAWLRVEWANRAGQAFRDGAVAFFNTAPYKGCR